VAPFDGTVVALADAEYGDYISTGQYYVAVSDSSTLYARCENISTTVLEHLEKIIFWNDGKEYDAVSIPMSQAYHMVTKNNKEDAYSEFSVSDPDGEISYGDYGKIKLVIETKTDVLMVPQTTVRMSGGVYYVYKDVDGKQERVDVTVGDKNDLCVEILEGLEEGDVVYVQE
jgi:multidrug efflux pump subunit AcrA (membrane-fusion protein)